jgi:hypothetical protein
LTVSAETPEKLDNSKGRATTVDKTFLVIECFFILFILSRIIFPTIGNRQ